MYWDCCWDWAASTVQLGLHSCQDVHHVGLGPGRVHQLGCQSGWVACPPVHSVQLGLHTALVGWLGHDSGCYGVQLGCLSGNLAGVESLQCLLLLVLAVQLGHCPVPVLAVQLGLHPVVQLGGSLDF